MPVKRIKRQEFNDALRLLEGNKLQAKVGFFESAHYPDGTPIAYVATIQEFGYPKGGIPQRSFIRSTIAEQANGYWKQVMAKYGKMVVTGHATPADALEAMALVAEGDMRKKITKITSPALSTRTLDARWARGNGNDKPLVDTGAMLAHLTSVVEAKQT